MFALMPEPETMTIRTGGPDEARGNASLATGWMDISNMTEWHLNTAQAQVFINRTHLGFATSNAHRFQPTIVGGQAGVYHGPPLGNDSVHMVGGQAGVYHGNNSRVEIIGGDAGV